LVPQRKKLALKRKIEDFPGHLSFSSACAFKWGITSIKEENHRPWLSAFVFRGKDRPLIKRGSVLRPSDSKKPLCFWWLYRKGCFPGDLAQQQPSEWLPEPFFKGLPPVLAMRRSPRRCWSGWEGQKNK